MTVYPSSPITIAAIFFVNHDIHQGNVVSDRMVVVATTNVGHLERFVNAKYWQAIA
ncbi:MAG: hypothetical protein M1G31_30820 [Pseudanabaena sp. Salubria-1]|nr:hypothetical protein [Pseudanabaena sp. Salubria-1]